MHLFQSCQIYMAQVLRVSRVKAGGCQTCPSGEEFILIYDTHTHTRAHDHTRIEGWI